MTYNISVGNNEFIAIDRGILKKVGLDEAIILGELVAEENYRVENGVLNQGDYFDFNVNLLEYQTTLSAHRQKKALDRLKELGLIDYKLQGCPATRYIKISKPKHY